MRKVSADVRALFDPAYYLAHNADVRASGIDPFAHYVANGAAEGRDPHPLFDAEHYRAQLGATAAATLGDPLAHWLERGWRGGLDPHPLFSTRFYLDQAGRGALRGDLDPICHYVSIGASLDLDPHPLFDTSFHRTRRGAMGDRDPLSHFLLDRGPSADPHPLFSNAQYARDVPGLELVGPQSVLHFLRVGRAEGRAPRRHFELGEDRFVVTEFDELRHDGRPVVLLVVAASDGAASVEELESACPREACVTLLLRPADAALWGEGVRDLWALSALEGAVPALLFDPATQARGLRAVVHGVGASEILVAGRSADVATRRAPAKELAESLGLPFHVAKFGLPASRGPSGQVLGGGLQRVRKWHLARSLAAAGRRAVVRAPAVAGRSSRSIVVRSPT